LYSEQLHSKILIANKKFNHVDYKWAKDVKMLVYDESIKEVLAMKSQHLFLRILAMI